MTDANKSETEKIDLAKLDGDVYFKFFKKILRGTNPWYFFKPALFLISSIGFLFGLMYSLLHSDFKNEESNKTTSPTIVIPNASTSNTQLTSADDNMQEKLKIAQVTIDDLKKENDNFKVTNITNNTNNTNNIKLYFYNKR
jgi:uncharacterized membrane protein